MTRVLVTSIDTKLGRAVHDHFAARGAVTAAPPPETDHADATAVRAAVDAAAAAMGGVDVLVTTHGLPFVAGITEQSMADFWAHVDVTLTGSFLYAQAAAEHMRRNATGGRIVLTTSRWHIGGPGLSAVATAAGGIVALTKTLTRDFGPFGIGVNAVAVGAVDSEWSVCDPDGPVGPGGPGTVEQIANLIGLLSRSELKAAVGQIVNADGGWSRNRV
ncbi:SDR family NAD(P)-dependent oxidoreductase [uncultured Mycolicibacterium sp.]|uniref:SDR family NAD(P)-dependent oxidoreductase n=1 Tax=uncultured Mycolicibacterium sp. TaxID=2320817 RepID=UPI0026058ECB|nr:SDR family oxidoreductase [uncultured Mycolicibacterium sp.]